MDGANFSTPLRPMTSVDFPEAIELALEKYRHLHPRLTYENALAFCQMVEQNQNYLMIRGNDVFFCATAIRTFIEPEITVGGIWLFTKNPNLREVLSALDAMEAWSRRIGAVECGWGNINGEDLTPIARKRGYDRTSQYFFKKLNGGIQ